MLPLSVQESTQNSNAEKVRFPRNKTTKPLDRPLLADRSYIAKMNRGPNFKPSQLKTVDSVEPVSSLQSDSVNNARAKKYNIRTYRKKNMTKLVGNNFNESDYMAVTRG